jgi:epoxyqueuosine reductase
MNNSNDNILSSGIKNKVHELGFDICGIAKARSLGEYRPFLESWVEAGMNDKMGYLARNLEKRLDPGYLLQGAKSLVVTGLSYFSENMQKDPEAPVLSKYTYGINYHDVISAKLEKLLTWIKSNEPDTEGSIVVDSAPLLEKAWAKEAGLGWQGRHSVMINREIGSFFFIGTLILDIELEYDIPFRGEYCKECKICIEACPTGAINNNKTIDARKCIANLTIENRGPIPEEIIPHLGRRIYGCDRCQEVCPWNKKVKTNTTPEFSINHEVAGMSLKDWTSLTPEKFSMLFGRTAIGRVKYEQLMKNIEAVLKQQN